jgi:hypothetical protein
MSKDINKKNNSFFESLSDEQQKSVKFFLHTQYEKQQLLKEKDTIDIEINVITTYEKEEQQIFDLMINDFKPDLMCSVTNEIMILSQIIGCLKELNDRDLDYLLKISIGYMEYFVDGELQSFADSKGREMFIGSNNLLETITRCNSKYYFQPNQRDIVSRIVADSFDVSKLTSEHDKQDYIDHMVNSPRYIEGKSLIEEHKPTFIEEVV